MAGFKLTQKNAFVEPRESAGRLSICMVFFGPWSGARQTFVDAFHILHALGLEPFSKCAFSAADKHANAILPSRPAAQNAAVLDACVTCESKGFAKCAITDSRREKQKGLCGYCGGTTK